MNSNDIDMLYNGYCIISFKYEDSSEVQCVSTLNLEILKNLGLSHIDGFIDLLTYKLIPDDMFLNISNISIKEGKETTLGNLDSFFQMQIKRRWQNVM